eukprot:4226997-Amphidinium_carterae.2
MYHCRSSTPIDRRVVVIPSKANDTINMDQDFSHGQDPSTGSLDTHTSALQSYSTMSPIVPKVSTLMQSDKTTKRQTAAQ